MSQQVLFGLSNASARALGQARRHYAPKRTEEASKIQSSSLPLKSSIGRLQQAAITTKAPSQVVGSESAAETLHHAAMTAPDSTHDSLEWDKAGDVASMDCQSSADDVSEPDAEQELESELDLEEGRPAPNSSSDDLLGSRYPHYLSSLEWAGFRKLLPTLTRLDFCCYLSASDLGPYQVFRILFPEFQALRTCWYEFSPATPHADATYEAPMTTGPGHPLSPIIDACMYFGRRYKDGSGTYTSKIRRLKEKASDLTMTSWALSSEDLYLVRFVASQYLDIGNGWEGNAENVNPHHGFPNSSSNEWQAMPGLRYAGFSGDDRPQSISDLVAGLRKKQESSEYSGGEQDMTSLASHSTFTLRQWIHEVNTNRSIMSD